MTFDADESSVESSRPVELYKFAQGNDDFLYTSAEDDITIGLDVYRAIPIRRTAPVQGAEDRDRDIQVVVPATDSFVQQYILVVPGQRATLTIQRFQRPTGTSELVLIFKGIVQSVAFNKLGREAIISVLPIESATSRPIPRFTYMGLCNHVLYDARCKVVETNFDFFGTASAFDSATNVLTVPGLNAESDGFYDGGFVLFSSINDFRLILSHTGNDITLLLPFPETVVGENVTVFAGCDHTLATCKTKFDNVLNYGGFQFVPTANPFEVGLV